MASTLTCRGCRVSIGTKVIPEFMGIGSLFGDEEANNTLESLFCAKCLKGHAKSSMQIQKCGHHSVMCSFQTDHSCYFPECAKTNNYAQTEDDDCIFCSEILASATCASFKCGHLFHESCITTHFKNMVAPKSGLVGITNSYCPLCKADMKWTGEYSPFQQLVHDVEAMKAHIKYLCVAQIEKDNGKDSLPSDTLAYGMKHYNFYKCSKCESMYCGGKRECGDVEPEGENVFLCGGCRGCPKHGDEFMAYKCRYCCSEALYFCFGHTHYCNHCHSNNLRATGTNHQYMSSAPPACEGRQKCPLKIDHALHGEEFALRCTACSDEVKDEFGSEIELLYKTWHHGKVDFVVEALAANRLCKLFIEIEKAEEEDWGGLFGDDEEEDDGVAGMGGLFGDDQEDDKQEEDEGEDWILRMGGLFGDDDQVIAEEEEEEQEWMARIHVGGLFADMEEEEAAQQNVEVAEQQGEEQLEDQPTTSPLTTSTTTSPPSSPLLRLLCMTKLLYTNLPQLAVVAATAAFLNSASYTMV